MWRSIFIKGICGALVGAVLLPCVAAGRVPALNQKVICGAVRVPLPKGVSQEAPPAVQTFTYTWRRDNKSGTEDRFDPQQLWEHDQRLGKWRDNAGNTYELVAPKSLKGSFNKGISEKYPPSMKHVLMEEYQLNRRSVGKMTRKDLSQWLTDWTQKTFGKPQKLRGAGGVSQAMFSTAEGAVALIVYLKGEANQPYVLLVSTPNDAPDTWKTPLSRALSGFALAKQQLTTPAANVKGWQTYDRPPYRVLSNLPKQYANFLNRLSENMQEMRKVYTTYIPEPKDTEVPVSVIRVFASPEEYHAYVGEGMEWSAGVFSSTHRELVVMGDLSSGSKQQQKEDIRSITFHEGFHQYLFSISPPTLYVPLWFNEGHATFFETFERTKKGAKPALSARLLQVQRDARFCTPEGLAQLMRFTPEVFCRDDNRMTAYASSWVLVHWLRTAAPPPLAATLNDYYALLCKGKTPQEAQRAVYPPEVLKQISEGLQRFISKQTYSPDHK